MSDLRERLGRLPLERRVRFLSLLRAGQDDRPAESPTRRERGDTAPLSHAQNLLWFLDRLSPGLPTYNIVLCLRLRGALDVAALEFALATVVARHETLRTSLRELDGGPCQVISPTVPVRLRATGVDRDGAAERRAQARELAEKLAQTPFDLGDGPLWRAGLFRTDEDEHLFVFVVHHVIFDGISAEVFTGELAELYGASVERRAPQLPDLPVQYADFALWQREWLSGPRLAKLSAYWRGQLADLPVLEIPTDLPRPPVFTFRGALERGPLSGEAVTAAHRLARELGVTPYAVYVAVLMTLLHRYSHQEDLVFGCSTSVRGRLELESLVGFFVNMLALRVDVGGDPSFRELVSRVDRVVREGFAHVDLPFEQVVQEVAPVRDLSRSPLVQLTFLLPERPRAVRIHGVDVDFEEPQTATSKFDMTWQVYEAGEQSSIDVEYCVDLFRPETVRSMQAHFARLLELAADAPDQALSGLDLLTPAEHTELVEHWDGPRHHRSARTVDDWFAEVAAHDPAAVAVSAGDRSLTYGELEERANRLAHLLRARGADREKLVALCLPRGVEHPVAVLAVLKAGAGFVPLDPAAPPDRIAGLLADADPCAVLTVTASAAGLPADRSDVLHLDRLDAELAAQPTTPPARAGAPGDLAYALYTSGSTGTPKGVLIEHRAVVNFIRSAQELFDLTAADRVLGYASYTFDVSVFELFAALLTGARLVVAEDADRLDLERLQNLLEHNEISVIDLPPSVMALLEPARLTRLRISFVGGEAFPGELVNRWNAVSRFFNGYGPTECTVTMIVQECSGHWDSSPPIGLPMANHVAHVLDESLRPVPYGVPGELVIGGAGLARGYLRRPELTGEKFVPDPFGTAPGGRLYRTGDLVKRQRDGAIVFLGRVDRQIKIRGVRIEPGEIEAVLAASPGVRQSYVMPWSDSRDQRYLVAYVGAPDGEVGAEELRAFAATKLPAGLVPQFVVVLPELPLTPSGKVDVRALPDPDAVARGGTQIVVPRTETEKVLAEELFGPMLRLDAVDVVTRFFELGGSSLQAAQLIFRIRRRFDVEITVADFFQDSTVAGLAVLVDRQRAARLDEDELLDLLEQMSDEEVERFMGAREGTGQ
ncbi:non-ribosomal peptide synthetase [Actinosynnema sp. NPDC047251]|uniref:Non-ribosomal peptide synthetase n=1 Tax=Saccharothrix espanaensis (strain ATCC 51144 / DSM 44229 / JCM 9112 / NBRC 15066 / NRRL 15764) TaxID=1179773 RepID=K0K8E4_SACES|nr:non-ribosomal peptide synthetase [Saccharothrix espanaensis]CCH32938.1 Non-ribosomal peptide synthetase [Saccharothrix espanaensis DSM 44229]